MAACSVAFGSPNVIPDAIVTHSRTPDRNRSPTATRNATGPSYSFARPHQLVLALIRSEAATWSGPAHEYPYSEAGPAGHCRRNPGPGPLHGNERVSQYTSPFSSVETRSRSNPSFSRTRSDGVFHVPTVDQSRFRPVAAAAVTTAPAASVA